MSIAGLSLGKGTLLGTGYIKVTADTAEAESRLGGLGTALGVGVAGLGALAAAGAATITMANDFNNKMLMIQTQAGGTAKDVQYLSNAVLSLKDVQQSPDQLAEALYHLKSVGLDNVTAMKDLKVASDLASVGNSDLEATTNALAGAWRSGIKGAQDMGQAAATVNAIIGAGNMRMTDFVSAISTGILPSAKTFGLSLQSVGAAMALMTDEGIPAVDAATRLRMSFSLMGAPSKAANAQLKKIGLTGLELADAMRGPQGIIGAIQLLKDHLDASGLSASEQAALLSRAFGGGRSNSAILTMLNNLDVLKQKQDQINKSMGAFPDAVKAQQQTLSAQIKIMENNLQDIGIKVGEALIGPVTWFVTFLNSTAVPAITNFFAVVTKALPVQNFGSGLSSFFKAFAGPSTAGAPPRTFSSTPLMPAAASIGTTTSHTLREDNPLIAPTVLPSLMMRSHTSHEDLAAALAPPPQTLSAWTSFGTQLKRVFTGDLVPDLRDIGKFLQDVAVSAGNLWTAAQPLVELLASVGLKTLDTLASVLANQIGPGLKALTGFIRDNSTVIGILLTVYLTPLLAKLLVLNTIKSVTAIGGLAKDIATFPVDNFNKIKEGITDFAGKISGLSNPLSGFTKPGGPLDEIKLRGMYAGEALTTFKGKVVELAQASWETVTTQAGNLAMGAKMLGQNLVSLAQGGWTALTTNAGKIAEGFKAAGSAAIQMGSDILTGIKMYGAQAWAGMVAGVGKLKDAMIALRDSELAATIAEQAQVIWAGIVMAAEKVWTVIQAALDVVLDANPIALVVLALAGLAAALIYAYNHSKTFRDIVQGAFKVISDAGSFMWNDILKPVFQALVMSFLAVAKTIVDGAAKMFGWVPGIGGMLKGAAKAFDGFANDVNKSLGGIQSKTVPVTVTVNGQTLPNQGSVSGHTYTSTTGWTYATGGPITGGVAGKDSVPILAMPDEHVWTAKEVQAAGGHNAMYAMRSAVLSGGMKRYAGGGPVYHGLALDTSTPTELGMDNAIRPMAQTVINSSVKVMMTALAKALKNWASRGAGGAGISVPGHPSGTVAQWFAQGIAAAGVPVSWTNDEMTIGYYESGWDPNAINLTDSNAAAGDPSRGIMQEIMSTFLAYHVPGTSYNIFDPVANIASASRYIAGRYGDVSNVPGIRSLAAGGGYVGYDSGGVAMGPGFLPKWTPRPERVLSPGQTASFDRLVDVLDNSGVAGHGRGTEVHVHFHGPVGSPSELEDWLIRALVSAKRNSRLRTIIPGT